MDYIFMIFTNIQKNNWLKLSSNDKKRYNLHNITYFRFKIFPSKLCKFLKNYVGNFRVNLIILPKYIK